METTLPSTVVEKELVKKALHWRYATKVFDAYKLVAEDEFKILMEALRLSPSSIDMQPWKFVMIRNKAMRKQMVELSMQQNQLAEASHLILLCSLNTIDANYIDRLIIREKEQSAGLSTFEQYKTLALSYINSKSKEQLREWMGEQVYIALGFLLATCAMLHIDACPIEGFDHARVNKLLGLHEKGIECRVAVAIGYRSQKDQHSRDKKLRWPKEEIFLTI
jgi:nitroreductase